MIKIALNLFITLFLSVSLFAQEELDYKVYWKNSLHIESKDKAFKFKIGGRIQYDIASFYDDNEIQNSIGSSINGVEIRRARFFNSGELYKNIKYKLQLDFAGGAAKLNDAYIKITQIPVAGFLQIGHFKEPIGFEEMTSSKYLTFMERSLGSESEPSRNAGFMIGNSLIKNRFSFRFGVFKDADGFGNNTEKQDKYNLSGRLFGTPVYQADAHKILHLGVSYSYRNLQNNVYSLSVRPEAHLSQKFLNTGVFTDANHRQILQAELAFVGGAFSFISEMVHNRINRTENPNFNYTAFYVMGSYFLTGESKAYKTTGKFSRLKPKKNFGDGGLGAWEIGLRFSNMNLNQENVTGGNLNDISFALNWYLNPSTRIMTNYILAKLKDVGMSNIFQMRFQVDF